MYVCTYIHISVMITCFNIHTYIVSLLCEFTTNALKKLLRSNPFLLHFYGYMGAGVHAADSNSNCFLSKLVYTVFTKVISYVLTTA